MKNAFIQEEPIHTVGTAEADDDDEDSLMDEFGDFTDAEIDDLNEFVSHASQMGDDDEECEDDEEEESSEPMDC